MKIYINMKIYKYIEMHIERYLSEISKKVYEKQKV